MVYKLSYITQKVIRDKIENISLSEIVLTAPDFAVGKTYVYKYETVLLSGLPEEELARSGLKISSKVLISAIAENMFTLKVAIKIMSKQQSSHF